jgi:hypothetical protein
MYPRPQPRSTRFGTPGYASERKPRPFVHAVQMRTLGAACLAQHRALAQAKSRSPDIGMATNSGAPDGSEFHHSDRSRKCAFRNVTKGGALEFLPRLNRHRFG